MFRKSRIKKLENKIDSIDKELKRLHENSTVRVVDDYRSIYHEHMFGPYSYHKYVDMPVGEIVCRIMDHLGLKLKYKRGRQAIGEGATLVKDDDLQETVAELSPQEVE